MNIFHFLRLNFHYHLKLSLGKRNSETSSSIRLPMVSFSFSSNRFPAQGQGFLESWCPSWSFQPHQWVICWILLMFSFDFSIPCRELSRRQTSQLCLVRCILLHVAHSYIHACKHEPNQLGFTRYQNFPLQILNSPFVHPHLFTVSL